MKIIPLLLFLVIIITNVKGQQISSGLKLLEFRIKSADSVILISHNATAGVYTRNEQTQKTIPPPQLLVNGELNDKIIHEKRALGPLAIQQLNKIITRPFEDREVSYAKCYIPHHTILLYSAGDVSHVEICFGCQQFKASKDLGDIGAFDKRKWKELFYFFKQNNMSYELDYEWLEEEN